jgi:hypothetical protein
MAMSFLDNLENNLKAMESRTERDPEALAGEAAAREAARSAALEIAPHAEALRNGPFKDAPLTACRTSVTASERFCCSSRAPLRRFATASMIGTRYRASITKAV